MKPFDPARQYLEQALLESISIRNRLELARNPSSMIDSGLLYRIVSCYIATYHKLTEHQLVTPITHSKSIH